MKKLLVSLFALSLAGSLYAGSGCGSSCSSKKSSEKTADKIEKEVAVEGTDSKECDSSSKKCGGKVEVKDA
jgi:hypothetical protein